MSCKYCETMESIYWNKDSILIREIYIEPDKSLTVNMLNCEDSVSVEIKYCPMCGGKLKKEDEMQDEVNHPSHYNKGKYEVIDVIEDWNLDFSLGNAIKYIARAEHKGNYEEDIKKAIWYLQREVNNNEAKHDG